MTEKQENILRAALQLFAAEGYHATPTSKVAKAAGVSEGLIFRHFGSKEGLLQGILDAGEEAGRKEIGLLLAEKDPESLLRMAIHRPFQVAEDAGQLEFWKLIYKLKYELGRTGEYGRDQLEKALASSFRKLGYAHPLKEASFFLLHFDAVVAALVTGTLEHPRSVRNYWLAKYGL